MRIPSPLLVAMPIALAASAPAAAQGPGPKTVHVDCTKGQSLAKALEDKTEELVIEIRGVCQEDVQIRRDDVTLRGGDPAADGIRGIGPGDRAGDAVVLVRDARNVRLENLSVRDGARNGVVVSNSSPVELTGCELVDSARFGLAAETNSNVFATDVTVSGSAIGIGGHYGFVQCVRCTVTDAVAAVAFGSSQNPSFEDSSLTGQFGVLADAGTLLTVRGSTITASQVALLSEVAARLVVRDSEIAGSLSLVDKGEIDLGSVVQTANPTGVNTVHGDSLLRVGAGSTLTGTTLVEEFGQLVLRGGASIAGDLSCSSAGDAFCDDPSAISGTVSGCGHCVKP